MSTTCLKPGPTPLDKQLWEAFYDERLSLIYFLHGLSSRETAIRMGLTEWNVKTLQYRALKAAAALARAADCETD